jgi:OmpA-OmpF porin, OOP family
LRLSSSFLPFVVATLASIPAVARADSASDADLRTFRASTDAYGTLATEGTTTPGSWNLQVGHWFVMESASLRMREATGETRRAIGPRLIGEPTVALGLGRRAAIGAVLPYVLYQDTESSSLSAGRPPPSNAVGDLALTGKAVAKEADPTAGGLGIAFVTRIQLPTGDRSSFISDKKTIAELRGLVSFDYLKVLQLTATAGYRMRFAEHPISDLRLQDTIPWGATLSLRPLALGLDPRKWLLSVEAHGELGAVPNQLFKSSRVSPAFIGLSMRRELAKDLALFAGVEMGLTDAFGAPLIRGILGITFAPTVIDDDHDGVPDDIDECPGLPEDHQGKKPYDGCPDYEGEETVDLPELPPPAATSGDPAVMPVASSDADGDGIPDEADKCPDQPETFNGYEDEDGCPELDRDGDTFLDAVDHCPDEAETFNGFNDDDGCPDEAPKGKAPPALISESAEGLVLARAIKFDHTAPAKESAGDLRAVAAWLLAHPDKRVRVAVKPEGKGDDAQKLAMTRAISIVEALVRYAHTGGVAEAVAWDPKATTKGNVALSTVARPAEAAPKPSATP